MLIELLRNLGLWKTAEKQKRYLLCVPHGGLNDTLCQISKCVEYAEQYQRTLIIDTKKSGLFRDFDDFFELKNKNVAIHTHVSDTIYQILNTQTCYPKQCQGQLDRYVSKFNKKLRRFTIDGKKHRTTFKFNRNYVHQCLVHEDCGGGLASMRLLARLQLREELAQRVRQQLAELGEDYVAIHVRHTDYQTDYKKCFKTIYSQLENKRVLVCSDNIDVINYAKRIFNSADVVTTSRPQLSGGQCLHEPSNYTNEQHKYDAPNAAIIDLICLASARTIYTPALANSKKKAKFSGFARLAKTLAQEKHIIKQLTRMT